MDKDIVLLDLFSGIGGFATGLSQSGFKIKKHLFSEINKHSIAVYRKQFKKAQYVGSVTDVRASEFERPNIITFGSPCQDFSLAGKREGISGERSGLISEAIRLITESQPDLFIWENVKGVFSSNDGADFIAILQAFTNIGNYRLEFQLLNSSWLLPQNRERVYLIGHHRRTSGRLVFPFTERNFRPTTQRTRAEKGKGIKVVSATKSGYETASIGDSVNLSQLTSKTRRGRVGNEKAQTLETSCNQAVVLASLFPDRNTNANGRRSKNVGEPAFSISSTVDAGIIVDGALRRFTEIECERLQGFADNWTAVGDYSDTENSDNTIRKISRTQRYKMLGNAVTVDIVEAIGNRLLNN